MTDTILTKLTSLIIEPIGNQRLLDALRGTERHCCGTPATSVLHTCA